MAGERSSVRRPSATLLIGCVLGIVLLGLASGWLSNSGYGNPWFDALEKPSFMPPGWAFPVAWTTLYVLLGIVAAITAAAPESHSRSMGLRLFGAQMLLNFLWSPIFFGMREPAIAMGIIAVMLAAAAGAAYHLGKVRPAAGWLMLPYLAWLCFAAALNWQILALNPGA
mgnify:CR=1 FL=1